MVESEQRKAKVKNEQTAAILPHSLLTGFIGGIILGICGILLYYFNFSEVAPRTFTIRPWIVAKWTYRWPGDVISVLVTGILSIIPAFIYYGLFKRMKSILFASAFGIAIWAIIFYVLHPVFNHIPAVTEMNITTIVSTICLFVLYGTFIGFSISYDYYDRVLKVWDKHR